MNFGAFAGGFSQGFGNGVSMGKSLRDVIKERKLDDLREQGMAEAQKQHEATVSGMIKEQGFQATDAPTSGPTDNTTPKAEAPKAETTTPEAVPATTTPVAPSVSTQTPAAPATVQATPSTQAQASPTQSVAGTGVAGAAPKFVVNGTSYDTREQAMEAARKSAPTAMDLFLKNTGPRIAEQYLANGDPATAKAWTDYTESANGKRAIKDWAAAYSAPDFDTAVSRFGKYYTDHINDGVDYTGHKLVTKEDGTQVAVVSLKDKATGKTQEMELTREKMLALGGANNPQKLFEQEVAKQREADKIKLEAQLKAQERRERLQDDLKRDKYKEDRQDQRENTKQDRLDQRERIKASVGMEETKGKAQVEIDTKIDALQGAGYSEDEIKKMMPSIVGGGDHKKTTDPTERRALIAADLVRNDPTFSRKPPEQQNKQIDDLMGVIYGKNAPVNDSQTPAKPAVATKPMAYDPKLPVKYQKGTGKPFHLVNGQYIPIEGQVPTPGAAPAAAPAGPRGGMPPAGATGKW